MIKVWKRKQYEMLLFTVLAIVFLALTHILVSVRFSSDLKSDFTYQVTNPILIFVLIMLLALMLWLYRKEVPKAVILDTSKNKLVIIRNGETLQFNLELIQFKRVQKGAIAMLELHKTIHPNTNASILKKATTIAVPNWGTYFNGKILDAIAEELRIEEVKEIE